MIPCRDCPQRYIDQTSKKIETRITERKNAIKRHDLRSLHAAHTYDNCHTFNWTETQLLGRAQTKHVHAREFKEVWYSTDSNTINRHIDIPTIYLQLKTLHRSSTNDVNVTNINNVHSPIVPITTKCSQPWQRIPQPPIITDQPLNSQSDALNVYEVN